MIKIAVELWVHGHFKTGEPVDIDIFNVTGERIPLLVLRYILDDMRDLENWESSDLERLEPENAYMCLFEVWYTEHAEIKLIEFLKLPIPDEMTTKQPAASNGGEGR